MVWVFVSFVGLGEGREGSGKGGSFCFSLVIFCLELGRCFFFRGFYILFGMGIVILCFYRFFVILIVSFRVL